MLAEDAGMSRNALSLIGRSRKQKTVLGNDFVTEKFLIDGTEYSYKQFEGCFSQPNAGMCQHMLKWARDVTQNLQEISKRSVAAAKENIEANNTTNIEVVRMSSEEFTEAYHSGTTIKGVDTTEYDFTTVLVDPPRAGLDPDTEKLVCEFENIVYISCNPQTLRGNLDHILKTHTIQHVAMFDQFPYTEHTECGVFLARKAQEDPAENALPEP
eukprot:jgi/Pico_ML_1/54772/g638.t1